MSKNIKREESVENVPKEGGVIFFLANRPAIAKLGKIIETLAINMTKPKDKL